MSCILLENRAKNLATLCQLCARPRQTRSSCPPHTAPRGTSYYHISQMGSASRWRDWVPNRGSGTFGPMPFPHLTSPHPQSLFLCSVSPSTARLALRPAQPGFPNS